MLEVAGDLRRLLDRLGERQPVGQAGQAVAQHLGAERALGLDLDRAVDDAEQAARRVAGLRKRRQLDPEIPRRNAFAVPEVELAVDIGAVEEAVEQSAIGPSSGSRPRSSRSRCRSERCDGLDEAVVVGGDVEAAVGALDDRGGDRQGAEQAGIVRRSRGAVLRLNLSARRCLAAAAGGLLQPACSASMARGVNSTYLCPSVRCLTDVRLIGQAKRLLRGKPIGGMRPAAPRAARHGVRSLSVRTRPLSPPSAQLSPSASANAIASRQAAVAIALQRDALPARQLGQLGEREHQHLAVLADHRDRVRAVGDRPHHRDLAPRAAG